MVDFIHKVIRKLPKRNACKAHIDQTNARCSRKAIWGTRYCWQHESKFFVALTLIISAFSFGWGLVKPKLFPSEEARELKDLGALQNRRSHIRWSINDVSLTNDLGGFNFTNVAVLIPADGTTANLRICAFNDGLAAVKSPSIDVLSPMGLPCVECPGCHFETNAPSYHRTVYGGFPIIRVNEAVCLDVRFSLTNVPVPIEAMSDSDFGLIIKLWQEDATNASCTANYILFRKGITKSSLAVRTNGHFVAVGEP